MAKEDQFSRTPPNDPSPAADEIRQQRVLTMLANGLIKKAEAQECAALILIHSGLTFCEGSLKAISIDNYYLAYQLAKSATEKGRKSARRLAADALDRFLVFSGKSQKYGTQTILDPKTNKMILPPIDPSTTDEERAKWGVEPLAMIMQQFKKNHP